MRTNRLGLSSGPAAELSRVMFTDNLPGVGTTGAGVTGMNLDELGKRMVQGEAEFQVDRLVQIYSADIVI